MDFLNKLKELLEVDSNAKFARLCGKQASNMAGYLKGKTPGTSVLQDCLLNATVARILDSPADADARLEGKAPKLRERSLDTSMSRVFDHGIKTLCEVEAMPEDMNDISDVGDVHVLYDICWQRALCWQGKELSKRSSPNRRQECTCRNEVRSGHAESEASTLGSCLLHVSLRNRKPEPSAQHRSALDTGVH